MSFANSVVGLSVASFFGLAIMFSSRPCHAARFTTLYSFTNGADGAQPYGGLVQGPDGTIYGTTDQGGDPSCKTSRCSYYGTVFKFTRTGGLQTILRFTGTNGNGPSNTLLLRGSTLYGNTGGGGMFDKGVLFSVNIDGSGYVQLHQFSGADGAFPTGTPQRAADGTIYGIALQGGQNGLGVLYALQLNGTYSILHVFTGGSDGGAPTSLLMSSDGTLYGSTFQGGVHCAAEIGCGVVYSYRPSTNIYKVVQNFVGRDEPLLGSMGPGPTIYGTVVGSSENDIFAITPSGSSIVAALKVYNSGVQYPGPTLAADGSLLLTEGQSAFGGDGTLLRVQSGKISGSYAFGQGAGGGEPSGQPIQSLTGSVLGTTSLYGLCNQCGTLYEVAP